MKYSLFFIIGCLTITQTFAQPKKVIADKIIGQVGDKIILRSDVVNAIADYKRQGQEAQLPPNPECAFLEGQLIQKALVLQAEKDSLVVSDEEIEAALDNQIRGFIQAYGSKEMLEEISGRTIYQLKDDFRGPFREKKLADQMRSKIVDNVKITPNEVKAYFNKIPKDSLPYYESEIELSQIVSIPKSNKEVDEYVIKQMYEYKRQVENGVKKFEALAKQFSEDPGSKENGGMYNINRTEKFWDKDFMNACFRLKEGQISPVIKSKFGYHIIQMVSRAGDDAVIRHILRIPPITEEEILLSIQKLDSVRKNIVAGKLTFGEAVNKHSDDEGSKFNGGAITARNGSTYITIDELDKDLVIAIKNLKVGEYSKPLTFDDRGVKKVRIVYLKTRTEPHQENMREDYNKVAERALDEKKQATLEKWFKEHLPKYYITIDKEFANCESLGDWWKFASNR
ncbi:MAG: peptidylprolyl isomerase [Chitinophagaceae bacterium]|jgi:peptidyl-prolyl cis-trans isomerase SurA|nr:peptidylprolyl isomerase [Chitinophagaceae bacterium]MBP9739098.1 peptidylprolyl isomerase [Chitinophagaceae bacterium]